MFFNVFSYIFKGDVVFIKNEKPYSHSVDYGRSKCLYFVVLAMILEIYVFRRCVFNDFLSRFRCKNHVHWWSPRLKNSGNPCAKLIILVLFVFAIVEHLRTNEKIMKFRSPFGVTHTSISVLFIQI